MDLQAFNPDSRQIFAQNATECVTKASALLSVVTAPAQIDELGFALNVAGPIALIARSASGLSTPALRQALVDANNTLTSRMSESTVCQANVVADDSGPSLPKPVRLKCTAYNGETGSDRSMCKCPAGQPQPEFDYSVARRSALRNTSHEVANLVLPNLAA